MNWKRSPKTLRDQSRTALQDSQLQHNLQHTLSRTLHSRQLAVSEVQNWEELRHYARTVKLHTLSHLARYLEQLEAAVQQRGGQVIWAESARQATDFILDLAHRRDFRSVVKGKSMLGEEIGLNAALERWLEVVETDLGEYIVQLAGQQPSHLVAPALHLSRGQIGELFERKLDVSVGEDVERITAAARQVLRRKFLSAHLGITGVNFGVAETGTLVVVENEGNIRLSLSAPRVHVAIMGIEKVIPRLADLPVFLKLLIRSATGQRMTSYVNLVQGGRGPGERDGPSEFFLVLVDNGRSRILADAHLRETLACIRCGACQNICPVFQSIGGHAYGSTYQGPIGSILTPQLVGLQGAPEHPFASSLCGACRDICPVGIRIPDLLLELRHRIQREKGARAARLPVERWAFQIWSWLMSSRQRYELFSRWSRRLARWTAGDRLGRLSRVIPPLSRWNRERRLPELAPKSFRELHRASGEGGS